MYRDHSVAVVVPAYNESGLVGDVLETVPDFVDRVYAVDDRSTDGTWNEIRRVASDRLDASQTTADGVGGPVTPSDGDGRTAIPVTDRRADGGTTVERPVIVPIRHEANRGVGAAITTGYRRALDDGMEITAVMAGDGQMDPNELDRLLDPIVEGRAAYTKGNRLRGREFHDSMSSFRLFGNVLLSLLTKVSSGYWQMVDPQNGYTAISKEALEALDLDSLYEQYGFSNDVLVALNTREFPIADVSMPAVYGDEESHIDYTTFVPKLSWLLFRRFIRRLGDRYVIRDFHPLVGLYALGALGLAVTIGILGRILTGRDETSGTDEAARPSATDARLTLALSTVTAMLCSAMTVLLAMVFDRQANEGLVVVDE
ncbi:glycosyltransferase family 2 protein [Halovivax gelatinilyticus]|uniref:glycosyltransferase family 2 protein n=1 Tax=Halovivax gelatinilyticus TaxID=2961597 RepID=UPI0020CA883E|nr:glycosyltransferase family 2 protein [Halovivax gelatinilyticus]